MNRFFTRKDKVLDDGASGKKSKKGKKGYVEPEPKLDLTSALPSSDDFRTSLIMPSLSTRFSMLREQDNPNSMLGKASDDSVLSPKRQSRLHEFGFVPGGLSDIAEVSSISGSIRPPFANERQNSFDSSMTEDGSGSMMSRARPGEGNVLFGGRQKIYKISNTGSSTGRALYEDDVSMSTFQKLRQQEKEKLERERLNDEPPSPSRDLPYSPSLSGFSQRRETSSSTNSGTAATRSSTAATSIASQGVNSVPASSPALAGSTVPISPTTELQRSTTKKRLYDQGLDQHIQEQQSSALNRLNSIQRTRAPTGRSTPPLLFSQTRSATNLNDRFNRGGPFRTESPTPLSNSAILSRDAPSSGSSPVSSRPQSPPLASPLASDSEEAQTLHSALQPNDRGKATAMGAFNKPKQAFSEQQYTERLRQMQQEREASTPKLEKPPKPTLRERAQLEQRKRAESSETERMPPNPAETQAPSPFAVFQSAASQMRRPVPPPQNALPAIPKQAPQSVQSPDSQSGATFFTSPHSSDDEDERVKKPVARPTDLDRRLENIPTVSRPMNRPPPHILDHPALRSRNNSQVDLSEHPALRSRSNSRAPEQRSQPRPSTDTNSQPETVAAQQADGADIDSPTLGPDNGGLSGLIRQHLRNVSNVSSDYGDNDISMSPPANKNGPLSLRTQDVGNQRRHPTSETDTPALSTYSHSNPWDLEDLDSNFYGEGDSVSSTSPVDAHKPKPLMANFNTQNVQAQNRFPSQGEVVPRWERELKKTHQRDESTATQDDREAFQRELAQRKQAIQESLKNKAEPNHARSTSPGPGSLRTALGMLRSKSSRDSFATNDNPRPQDPSLKALKLGLGTASNNASSTSLAASADDDRIDRGFMRPKPARVLEQSEQDARRELGQRLQRTGTDDQSRDPRSKGRSPPESSTSSLRDRSSSEVSSGRSRSRTGRYRDDLEQAMTEGAGSRSTVYPPNQSPSVAGYMANPTQPLLPERPSVDSQQSRMRARSNSRPPAPGHLDGKHLQPIQTGQGPMNGSSPRLSPAAGGPSPQLSSGLPASPRPSPGAVSPNMPVFRPQPSPVPSAPATPPISGASTPVVPSFNPAAGPVPMPRSQIPRKKSIVKADISEPIFMSATSAFETVNLPAGASLKNGMEPAPPPVPPINPMRRRFGLGRSETHDSSMQNRPQFADPQRTNSDTMSGAQSQLQQRLRKTSSEGKSLHGRANPHSATGSPAMPSAPFGRKGSSPPRPINPHPIAQQPMDGAMF